MLPRDAAVQVWLVQVEIGHTLRQQNRGAAPDYMAREPKGGSLTKVAMHYATFSLAVGRGCGWRLGKPQPYFIGV